MEIQKFVEYFTEAIDANPVEVNENLVFKNHPQWDSMAVLSVIAMVDEYYSRVLTGEEIESSKTVRDLFAIVTSK